MITAVKSMLLTNWHPLRWVALFISLMFFWNAYTYDSGMAAVLGAFFAFQTITNTGCLVGSCAGGSCSPNVEKSTSQPIDDVSFDEIEGDKK